MGSDSVVGSLAVAWTCPAVEAACLFREQKLSGCEVFCTVALRLQSSVSVVVVYKLSRSRWIFLNLRLNQIPASIKARTSESLNHQEALNGHKEISLDFPECHIVDIIDYSLSLILSIL